MPPYRMWKALATLEPRPLTRVIAVAALLLPLLVIVVVALFPRLVVVAVLVCAVVVAELNASLTLKDLPRHTKLSSWMPKIPQFVYSFTFLPHSHRFQMLVRSCVKDCTFFLLDLFCPITGQ